MYQLRGAAHQISGDLQRVRVAAISENNRYRLTVTAGSAVYEVHDDNNNDDVENDGAGSVETLGLGDSPRVSFVNGAVFTFVPSGTVLSSGSVTLVNGSGQTKDISVSAGGQVRIE